MPFNASSCLAKLPLKVWHGCLITGGPLSGLTHCGLVTAYCGFRAGSALAQVRACCLTAPSHYLIQSWLIISRVLHHWSKCNSPRKAYESNCYSSFENNTLNPLHAKFFRGNINIYLHFMSLLHIDMTHVLKILPQVRPGPTYST